MSNLTVIGIEQSTYVRSIRMACVEKGVDYDLEPQMPHSDAVLDTNPFGKVPVLRHDDVMLSESEAIARYIDTVFDGPALFPSIPQAAALVNQWVSRVNTEYYRPLIQQYLFGYIFPKTDDGGPDRAQIDASLEVVEKCLGLADRSIGAFGYLASDSLSYADLNLYPILFYLNGMPESGEMIAGSAHLSGYLERIGERESARTTLPPPPPED